MIENSESHVIDFSALRAKRQREQQAEAEARAAEKAAAEAEAPAEEKAAEEKIAEAEAPIESEAEASVETEAEGAPLSEEETLISGIPINDDTDELCLLDALGEPDEDDIRALGANDGSTAMPRRPIPVLPTSLMTGVSMRLRTTLTAMYTALESTAMYAARDRSDDLDRSVAELMCTFYRQLHVALNLSGIAELRACEEFTVLEHDIFKLTRDICIEAAACFAIRGVRIALLCDVEQLNIAVNAVWYERLLLNLLANALFVSDESGIVVVRLEGDEEGVHLTVTDEGGGISPELIPEVFDIDCSDATIVDPTQSRGLGLLLCRLVAEAHEGTICIEPNATVGSAVHVMLPREHTKVLLFREMQYDYTGGYDHSFVELSECLPAETFMLDFMEI